MEEPKINPYAVLAIGVISVSTSAIFVKYSSAPSGVIAFYRLLFSVLLMLPVFLIKHVGELRRLRKKTGCIPSLPEYFWPFILFYGLSR